MKKISLLVVALFFVHNLFSQCGIISRVAGTGYSYYFGGDGAAATVAGFDDLHAVTIDRYGNLYLCDNDRIRKVNTAGIISTIAGGSSCGSGGDGGPATAAGLCDAEDITVDISGNIYIADRLNNRVRKISTAGIITTVAGTGTAGYSGDGGAATAAMLYNPTGVAVDTSGNVYIADGHNYRIRKVNTSGIISTFAGTGILGYTGDGGAAVSARLGFLTNVAVDTAGNVYIAERGSARIRKINASGIISTIAGSSSGGLAGTSGFSGDGGPATAALLDAPMGIRTDRYGNLYIADRDNQRIRKINTSGIITTIAGNGSRGRGGDGGAAIAAQLDYPVSVAIDRTGNVYIAENLNYLVRKVTPTGVTPTLAPISGPTAVNIGNTVTLSDTSAGGTWSSSDTTRATVSPGGVVTGITAGVVTITYNASGVCGTAFAQRRLTVINPHTPVFTVASPSLTGACGSQALDLGANLTVRDIDTGQTLTWSVVTAPTHGTLNLSGTAVSTGGIIRPTGKTYTAASGYTGADTFSVRISDGSTSSIILICLNVNVIPTTPTITGPTEVCILDSITLIGSPSGGLFNCAGGGIILGGAGVLRAVGTGTYTVTYTSPVSRGCASKAYVNINVKNKISSNSIIGPTTVCAAASITLRHDSTGGTWALSNMALASVSGGTIYGIAPGRDTLTYSYNNVCGTSRAMQWITINPLPNAGSVTGPDTVLVGGFINLTKTGSTTGIWSSTNNTIATVSSVGRVRGISAGIDTIVFTANNSCGTAIASKIIRVIAMGGKQDEQGSMSNNNLTEVENIKMWPNPTEGSVNIALPEAVGTICVIDASGRAVYNYSATGSVTTINLNQLPAGTYLLRIGCAGKIFTEHLVIK